MQAYCLGLPDITLEARGRAMRTMCVAVCLLAAGCSAAVDPMAIADAQAAARVKTVLVNDPELGGQTIEVRVAGGVALLSGRVRSQADADRAVTLARSVDGVQDVRADLQIGAAAPLPGEEPPQSDGLPEIDAFESDVVPGLLAIGVSAGRRAHRAANLLDGLTLGPLVRLGSGRGFGPALGFDWFSADIGPSDGSPGMSRVRIKPIMAGIGYTVAGDGASIAFSVVGGYAFNTLTVLDPGTSGAVALNIGNSVVWRPGLSLWVDTSRRTAINLSLGHVFTTFRLTTVEDGRLHERTQRGDTLLLRAGMVYKLF